MRRLALCILLMTPVVHAGESPPYGPAVKPEPTELWMACRLSIARSGRPMGSNDVVVHTAGTPRIQVSEAEAQQNLDYWTTNKAYPAQFTVVRTGWTYQAPDG